MSSGKAKGAVSYSEQQSAIIYSRSAPGVKKVVEAYSGCGKSTTLIGYANQRAGKRILYLSFNRSVALEAKRKFPKHVACMTMHSLAYKVNGLEYKEQLADRIPASEITPMLKGMVRTPQDLYTLAHHALQTFESWCASADAAPEPSHFSKQALDSIMAGCFNGQKLVDATLAIFKNMYQKKIPASHSLYLKLYQLSKPRLDFDIIMVDEAQDLNPVVMDILDNQPHAEIIKVGDRHQSIYEFRGAVDGLRDKSAERFFLTETYRFGQNLADMASAILINHKGATMPLTGLGSPVLIDDYEDEAMREYKKCPLYITRTNSAIIELLVDVLLKKEADGHRIFMPGGSKNYGLRDIQDAYHLKKTGEGRGAYSHYGSWDEFKEVSEMTGDPNSATTCKIVDRYMGAVTASIMKLSNAEVIKAKDASICITTAHKSKGLEHPFVVLSKDFPDLTNPEGPAVSEQEINLMYVALTRAQKAVHVCPSISRLVNATELEREIIRA